MKKYLGVVLGLFLLVGGWYGQGLWKTREKLARETRHLEASKAWVKKYAEKENLSREELEIGEQNIKNFTLLVEANKVSCLCGATLRSFVNGKFGCSSAPDMPGHAFCVLIGSRARLHYTHFLEGFWEVSGLILFKDGVILSL